MAEPGFKVKVGIMVNCSVGFRFSDEVRIRQSKSNPKIVKKVSSMVNRVGARVRAGC